MIALPLCATGSARAAPVDQSRSEALTGIIGGPGVHGLDDLAAVDAFASHLDGMGVPELVWRKPPPALLPRRRWAAARRVPRPATSGVRASRR